MTSTDPARACLSQDELDEAISALSDAGWIRLQKVANRYSYQGKIDSEELLQDAFLSAIEGRRKCPRDVDIVRFLAEAMRSLASSKMKSLDRKPELKLISLGNDDNELPYDPPTDEPNAEQEIFSSQEVADIKAPSCPFLMMMKLHRSSLRETWRRLMLQTFVTSLVSIRRGTSQSGA